MQNEKLDIKIRNLPTSPGVYLFKNKAGNIIYIGKAKNLRNRVRTYFQSANNQTPKTARMVSGIDDLELMVTDSEIEALILEANLIKEYKPRYNVNLKDDKHFPYIKVTVQEPFPRVLIVRRLENDGNRYFGPYTNSKGMRKTVHFLTRLFKIRSCNLTIPHPTGKPQKVCLDYHIGRCDGPCENLQSREDYAELVDSVMLFLSGKGVTLLEKLRNKMSRLSDDMEFEKAAETRDQIEALESVRQKQKVDAGVVVNRDIISFARDGRYTVVVIMQIREGVLIGRQDFQLTSQPEEVDSELLGGFVKQYYNHQPNLPQEIYLPLRLDDETVISRWLSKRLGSKVSIYTPQKGEKLKLVDLAATNARLLLDEILIQKKGYKERVSKSVQSLKDNLHLARSPRTIACVDISNTGETDAVGSLVYFSNGKPYKAGYRHFKIKEVGGQNDFAKEIASLGFENQNIIGLAKRFEEVYLPGHTEPLTIPKTSPGLLLLKRIRDEAHRFAIEYNRKVRSKRTVKSALDELDGIGPKRREILLRHFGSVKKIKTASLTDLQEVKGLPWNVAEKIYKAFH